MPTLANIQGSSLVPDVSPAINLALGAFGTKQQRDKEAAATQRQADTQAQVDIVAGGTASDAELQKALVRLTALNPQAATSLSGVLQAGDEKATAEVRRQAEKGLRQATLISAQPDFASKQRALTSLAAENIAAGEPLDRLIELQNMDEGQLDLELQKMQIMGKDIKSLTQVAGGDKFSKAPGVITTNADGSQSFEIPIFNQNTGDLEVKSAPISGTLVSKLGETPTETTIREVAQAGDTEAVKLVEQLEGAPKVTSATKQASAETARQQGFINEGFQAADTIPVLTRSLELLDTVKTGGIDAANLKASQFFGVEGADEAELSANLGKTVLSQLRSTFGAAFTEREGARLQNIEAGFGKSVAGNRRLLEQTRKIMERAANRGIKAAEKSGDTDTADQIREAMSFNLSPPPDADTAVGDLTDEQLQEIVSGGG